MHLVRLALEPAKKAAHAVPTIVFVIVVGVFAGALFSVNDKILIDFRQLLERNIDIDVPARARSKKILLRFTKFFAAENAHDTLFDIQPAIWNCLV